MKFYTKFFLFLTIFLSSFYTASASTLTAGVDVTSYTELLTVSFVCDSVGDVVMFNPNGVALSGYQCTTGTESGNFNTLSIFNFDNWIASPDVTGVYTVLITDIANTCIASTGDWDGVSDSLTACLASHTLPVATFSYGAGASPVVIDASIASFSVMGSSSASEMLAGVASGVRDTGLNLWVVVASAISLFFIFWVIENVISLFPDEKVTRPTSRKRK